MNDHLSREIQEVYSREEELPRNVIIRDTVTLSVTKETKRKVGRMERGERKRPFERLQKNMEAFKIKDNL